MTAFMRTKEHAMQAASMRSTAAASTAMMKAVIHGAYGEPEKLTAGETPKPVPGDDDVLIRVVAAGVSVGDYHIITGKPYLIRLSPFGGLPGPKHAVPGAAMSGRVESVGANATGFRVGDEVFG